ncbi:TetR family transcriptional regulator [Gordonia pseudamarae]|jgi:AcrR family transcriptional regulator|uniref:TetR/AcrR family transcriptional regulator n=1 Tax=Gordonia TaxID=2053 RepID=UPI00199CAB90|nr:MULTISPECIES: TetR/AcrR family transcriptional regulator [Gordonia]MBD0021790.1 TetR family transcriptional regulator [Gordonia sp. (in: high G+C Gram-positive bacteria)]QHN27917.1 TetR family transcriptional regulator [Gordonia pseudamarae]
MTSTSYARRRPRDFDGNSATELAVFDATEELLAQTSLQKLTVAKILKKAGISRANFYHYFANKYDVLVALLGRVLDTSYGADGPWSSEPGRNRSRQMGVSLESTLQMWDEHGAVICAVLEHMHSEPVVGRIWQGIFERFVDAVTEQIEFERGEGRAPVGPPADLVAAMLISAAERTFYVSSRGLDPRLPDVRSTVAPLRAINEAAIYGGRSLSIRESGTPIVAQSDSIVLTVPAPTVPAFGGEAADLEGTGRSILDAMRELLADIPLAELSVAQVLDRAGVSRASFYFYFRSKEDAFIVLFREAARDVVTGLATMGAIDRGDRAAFVDGVRQWLNLDDFANAVIRNAVHTWPWLPELRTEYLTAMSAMETVLTSLIETDRAAGLAPAGPAAPQYAATILWTVERTVAGALAGEEHLTDFPAVAAMVGDFLFAALYGRRDT